MLRSHKMFQKQEPRLWGFFLLCHFFVWTLVPLFRTNIPMDSAEAIVWGSEGTWGTNKHPSLAAWLAYGMHRLIPNPDLAVYMLSQLCVLVGFVFVYKLAKIILNDDKKALLSTVLLEGTIYYSICSVEFNVNVLSLAIVPMLTYTFYRAIQNNRFVTWMMVGVLAGVVLLTKYTNALFLIGFAAYLFATSEGRAQFKRLGLYIAAVIGLIVFAPHAYWMFMHDFYPLEYMAMRASGAKPWYGHITFPVAFLGAQLAACALTVMAFFIVRQTGKGKEAFQWKIPMFLICVGLVPLACWLLLSFIFNVSLKSMWGFPLLFMVPMMLFAAFPFRVTYADEKKGLFLTYVMMFVLALSCAGTSLLHISKRANFPGRAFATQMQAEWDNRYDGKISFVGGDIWFASNLAVYLPEKQHVLIDMNTKVAPWIDETELLKQGVVVATDSLENYIDYQKRYPQLTDAIQVTHMMYNATGKRKRQHVYVGFIAPTYQGREK